MGLRGRYQIGRHFFAEIEEGLREADLAVLFWSPEAAHCGWTRLVHRLISGRHTAVGDSADFQGASDERTLIRT